MTAVVNQLLASGAILVAAATVVHLVRPFAFLAARRHGLSFTMASLATAASLYYSEIAGFVPCELCWWQRIMMYPLVLLFGVGMIRGLDVRPIAILQALAGLAISSYHYLLQQVPDLAGDTCSVEAPCSAAWVWEYGFVSIPFMAGVAFSFIAVLNLRKGASP